MIGWLIKIEKHHLFFVLLFCSLTLGNCINLRKSFWYFCNLWYIINHLYLPLFQNPKAYTLKFWGGNFCNNIFFFWTSYTESWLFFVLRSIATKLYALNLILQDKISVFFCFLQPWEYYWWNYFVSQALGSECHCVSSTWGFFISIRLKHRYNTGGRTYSKVKNITTAVFFKVKNWLCLSFLLTVALYEKLGRLLIFLSFFFLFKI